MRGWEVKGTWTHKFLLLRLHEAAKQVSFLNLTQNAGTPQLEDGPYGTSTDLGGGLAQACPLC